MDRRRDAVPSRDHTGNIQGTHQKFVSDLEAKPDQGRATTRGQGSRHAFCIIRTSKASTPWFLPPCPAARADPGHPDGTRDRPGKGARLDHQPLCDAGHAHRISARQADPYIALAMVNFGLMFLMALFIFGVPLKGSFPVLAFGALLYVAATTAYGMLISAFTRPKSPHCSEQRSSPCCQQHSSPG